MILTLEIRGPEARLGGIHRKEFRGSGGSIGRLPESSLVLEDPYVSSRHALIHYVNGVYYIEDTSRNGLAINSPDNRLSSGQRYAIQSGDRILIEPYELRASLTDDAVPFVSGDPFELGETPGDEVDPIKGLKLGKARSATPAPPARRAEDLREGSLLNASYKPPAARPVEPDPEPAYQEQIPPNFLDESAIIPPPPLPPPPQAPAPKQSRGARPAARPSPPPPPAPAAGEVGLADVLAGAGLEGVEVTPELARNFGEILRVVVSGVMDVLQARQRTKEEFRMGVTTFKPTDNNPLKFSANVEDALHNLLVKRNAAYLAPVEAFEDAFDDLRNHQLAMLAGLRQAFETMLAQFEPDRLQEDFDRQIKKGALLAKPARLRYWELYRDWIHDKVRDVDASFRELFGDEFAQAYEEQLRRLKAQGRHGKS